jgi:hypothetical protein
MARTLRAVERSLQRVADKYGPPASFGAYLLRVMDALGLTTVVEGRPTHGERWISGYRYRWHNPQEAAGLVDRRVWEFLNDQEPDPERQPQAALSAG